MLFQALSQEDKDTIKSYIEEFGPSGEEWITSESMAPLEHILRIWNTNKAHLYKMFGNKFIIEFPVEVEKPYDLLHNEMERMMNSTAFLDRLSDKLFELAANDWDTYLSYSKILFTDEITNNSLSKEMIFKFADNDLLILPKGMKTIKGLRKLAERFGLQELFEDFRLKHSQILNQKKLTGTLCLSIHPMDFLTMSDNNDGWSSCMCWHHPGDYRMGTVEMMNSSMVCVAYLRDDHRNYEWGSGSWNSKKWRTLALVTPKIITTVKSYPYQSEKLYKLVVEILRVLAPEEWNMEEKIRQIKPGEPITTSSGVNTCFRFYTEGGFMYNDFGSADHYGVIGKNIAENTVRVYYNGPTECVWCGNTENDEFFESHHVFCSFCEYSEAKGMVYCEHCGNRVHEDDAYWVYGDCYCPSCFNDLYYIDEITDEYIYQDESIYYYLARTPDAPEVATDPYIVAHNYFTDERHYQEHSYYSRWFINPPHYDEATHQHYWNYSDVTDEGLKRLFGVSRPENDLTAI